jgi:hypothetical protein
MASFCSFHVYGVIVRHQNLNLAPMQIERSQLLNYAPNITAQLIHSCGCR